jgi:RNA polymerase sigma factor (sigma-70 family)
MRPRQTIPDLFSTFLQFEADQFQRWVTDARLRRSILNCQSAASQSASEDFWALYWHKVWQTQASPIAENHLAAYLQEPCYWAAKKTAAGFTNAQYTLADCFQMAIVRFDKVLKGFNATQGFNFKGYATATFLSLIRESLRLRQEVDICTDWGLLRKLSQKRLVESLAAAGLAVQAIDRHVLAWSCFRALYFPTQASATRKLPPPDAATWDSIAQRFNRERHAQLSMHEPSTTPEQLEKWLIASARAARAYLYPTFVSINTPKPGQESEFLDDLPQGIQASLLSDLIAEEEAQTRQDQRAEVNTVLTEALAKLDAEAIEILQMYYQQELTQQQMATRLNLKQYTVSRRLTKAKESLLLALAKWSQATLHITVTSDVLKHSSLLLEEWLKSHYRRSDLSTPEAAFVSKPSGTAAE